MDLTKNSTKIGLVVAVIIGIVGITQIIGDDTEEVATETTTETTEPVATETTDNEPVTTPATGNDITPETETE